MNKLATLYALHILAARWHSGQWSLGYLVLCRTADIAQREMGIRSLQDDVRLNRPEFRSAVARGLWRHRETARNCF